MKKIHLLLVLSLLAFTITSCKDDKEEIKEAEKAAPKVTVRFTPMYGDQEFAIGEIYYDALGHRLRVEGMSTYISFIGLKGMSDETFIKDFAMHFFNSTETPLVLTGEIKETTYDSLKFGIGVPRDFNKDQDPTQYPNSHPLSVQGSQGHFWTWNTGYIFTKFEGRADLSGTEGASLMHPFAYHTGDDLLYRAVAFPINLEAKAGGEYVLNVKFDIKKLIDNPADQIDLETDYLTHTAGNMPLAIRFANNVASSFSVQ